LVRHSLGTCSKRHCFDPKKHTKSSSSNRPRLKRKAAPITRRCNVPHRVADSNSVHLDNLTFEKGKSPLPDFRNTYIFPVILLQANQTTILPQVKPSPHHSSQASSNRLLSTTFILPQILYPRQVHSTVLHGSDLCWLHHIPNNGVVESPLLNIDVTTTRAIESVLM